MHRQRFFARNAWKTMQPPSKKKSQDTINTALVSALVTVVVTLTIQAIGYLAFTGPATLHLLKAEESHEEDLLRIQQHQAEEINHLMREITVSSDQKEELFYSVEERLLRNEPYIGRADATEFLIDDALRIGLIDRYLDNPALHRYLAAALQELSVEDKLLVMICTHSRFRPVDVRMFVELHQTARQNAVIADAVSVDLTGVYEQSYSAFGFQRVSTEVKLTDVYGRFVFISEGLLLAIIAVF